MRTEISAGGIVIRKTGQIWEVLVFRDMNDVLTFPKGKIETGETFLEAAKREISEETGITHISKILKLPVIRYTYKRKGIISKIVHYFLFHFTGTERASPQKEEGVHDITWMPLQKAIQSIGYATTNKPLLLKTKQWISHPRRTLKKS